MLINEHLDSKGPRKCALEGPGCSGRLTHDHIDGNRNNNSLFNFRWLCIGHQNKERARLARVGRAVESAGKNVSASADSSLEVETDSSAEMRMSSSWRPRWQAKLMEMILLRGTRKPVTVKEATSGLAQWIRSLTNNRKGSKVTCTRWLEEATTGPAAVFRLYELKQGGEVYVDVILERLAQQTGPWTSETPKVLEEKPSSS